MKNWVGSLLLALLFTPAIGAPPPQGGAPPPQGKEGTSRPLPWAYGVPDGPVPRPEPDDGTVRHLPASSGAFTLTQLRDGNNPVDWYPGDHPQMPYIVAHRRQPGAVGGCGFCHFPNGKGRPENAGPAGLPSAYIMQQIADFKNGARKSAEPGKRNTNQMIAIAKGLTDEETNAAAEYFSSIKWTPWIKVVETNTVPKTRNAGGFFLRMEGAETEPLGQRLLEVPVDTDGTELLRDPRSGFIAYVPVGTLKKGEALVTKGGPGKTVACAACHGADLKGNACFPPLAGRSPSYLARQLYDIQHYTRSGPAAQLMQPVVENLSEDDILAITAYVASLSP